MTEYAPRGSQDQNTFFPNSQLAMSQYSAGNGINYFYNHGQIPYPTVNGSYSSYPTNYLPSHNNANTTTSSSSSSSMYMPNTSPMAMPYQLLPPARPSMQSQSRSLSYPYHAGTLATQRAPPQRPHLSHASDFNLNPMTEIEDQDSFNSDSMLSEPLVPAMEGYPDVKEFDELMRRYVADLSPKKQDKALIHARRAVNIRIVLLDKKTTTVESAQFRFWVKKMFTLLPSDPSIPAHKKKICHEGKPVAVREKLFKILTKAHKTCQHGGRDKTSAQVRRVYSWVPKELISRFVKLCPTCKVRRGQNRTSPPESVKDTEDYDRSPETYSPSSRRDSCSTKHGSVSVQPPLPLQGFSSNFQHQNRWMTSAHTSDGKADNMEGVQTTSPSSYMLQGNMSPSTATTSSSSIARSNYNMSFSSVNSNNMYPSPSGFPPSNVRSNDNWQRAPPGYEVKSETHYS